MKNGSQNNVVVENIILFQLILVGKDMITLWLTAKKKVTNMANVKCKIKKGMKGSNGGKSRWERTEILKKQSKKRRKQDKDESKDI